MGPPGPKSVTDPRYKSKVREPGDFTSDGFKDWYMWLKLYINDNAPLLFTDSKKVGAAILMIRSPKVDSWVTAFTREHYLGSQWQISWPRFVWELHQKFNDPDLEKKAAVAAEKLTMQAGKGEEYFQELKRLLTDAKYDRENQVVHCWITSAIPKDIYTLVHQAFVATTINNKLQHGYNIQILEGYESWKQAILHTDNAMQCPRDEEKLWSHGKDTRTSDKGKECTRQEQPKTEPMEEQCANLLKWKCLSCGKMQAEQPDKKCTKTFWHQPNWWPLQANNTPTSSMQRTWQLTDGNEEPKVLSKIPQEDFVRMVSVWAKANLSQEK
ncbi:hypothetical protein WOLCODRAFT_155579 [Wolfiporia cocos MD-104 SS10]|uniref:Uncharacterized protein n=1 Tax=Wolfiporia cocos (strain MD-104) TaxID=742152 RepID=A0A2H3J563_WOLCO|nr:hypothetical protein WOLCODRAFT_155579 [Wolfiporia cocos MD-104 SS10]